MTSRAFRERLLRRVHRAAATLTLPSETIDRLEAYVDLLRRWNAKINLTALTLDPLTDESIDRLLIEPIVAARHLTRQFDPNDPTAARPSEPVVDSPAMWFDIGSGGGSPAIPLQLAGLGTPLTMVESKTRKAAFLREVVRTLGLTGTIVENDRAEAVAERSPGRGSLVTVRAVRLDSRFVAVAGRLLRGDGHLGLFCQAPPKTLLKGFELAQTVRLIDGQPSYLAVFEVFHVEQRR